MANKRKHNIPDESRRRMSEGGKKGGKAKVPKGFAVLKANDPDKYWSIIRKRTKQV